MRKWRWETCRTQQISTKLGVSSTWRTGPSGFWGTPSTTSNTDPSYQVSFSVWIWADAIKVAEFHSREIFPSHREVTIVVNNEDDKFTGTSGQRIWSESSNLGLDSRYNWLGIIGPQVPLDLDVEHPLQPQHLQLILRCGDGETQLQVQAEY